jgi:hypothetical protein
VSERERLLWRSIRRALLLIVGAIDAYMGNDEGMARKR